MKATIKMAKVYCNILEESRLEMVCEKDGRIHIGALFFPIDDWEEVREDIEAIEIDGSIMEILLTAYELKKKYGQIAKDDKSFLTMAHWQNVNGFSDNMMLDLGIYRYKTDTEFFKAHRIVI